MRCECGVNFSRFSAPLVGSPGDPVSLRRRRDEDRKSPRDKKTKRQRDKGTKGQREEGRKGGRDEESKGQRDEETKRRRGKGTKRGRDEGTRRRKPRHLLFTSYSCPLHRLFTAQFVQILFNSCPKTFARFVSKTVLRQGTPLRESSVKVNVGGKVGVGGTGKEKAQ